MLPLEESFGFVIVHRAEDKDLFLLVRQLSNWSFPKGHPEGDETPEQTAMRELFEECGVSEFEIIPGVSFKEEYTFVREGVEHQKKNVFFLGIAPSVALHPLPSEILECRYVSYDEALGLFEFDNAKRVLGEAKEALTKLPR